MPWRRPIVKAGQHVPFSGLVQAHTPAQAGPLRLQPWKALVRTDSPAERAGFEPSVPPRISALSRQPFSPLRHFRSAGETDSSCKRDWRFESRFLHRRVDAGVLGPERPSLELSAGRKLVV